MSFLVQKLQPGLVLFRIIILVLTYASTVDAQTLDRIKESGVIRLGYQTDTRPFSYSDESGSAKGYSMALCRKIVNEIKSSQGLKDLRTLEVSVSSTERFRAVQEGRIDLLCGATTETLSGRQAVSFSIPIFLSGIGALVRADAPSQIQTLLAGDKPQFRPHWRASYAQILQQRRYSVLKGTSSEDWLSERKNQLGTITTIVPVDDYEDGIGSVINRKADVFFGDRAILLDVAVRSPDVDALIVSPRLFTHEIMALALVRGDDNFRLLVDRVLTQLYRSGEIINIYKRYFGEPDDLTITLFTWAALPE